ncbi:MAG: hypothetical protein GF411_13250, partial [Candidatus Lokiarchaeota archaeon]|nr:hypothetical protein [Candidatus Lokiarchaeota archaeon]
MKTVFIGLLAILFLTSSIWIFPGSGENDEILQDQTIPETVDEIITRSYDSEGSHLFTNITITSDSELKKFIQDGNFTGSGTESDPYLIKDLETNNTDYNIIPYIHICNTTSHVVFENITIDERNYFKINTTKFRIADCSKIELREIDIESRFGPSFEMLRSNSIEISDYYSDPRYDDDLEDFVIIESEDIALNNCTSRDGIIIDFTRMLTIQNPSYYIISLTNSSKINLMEGIKDYAQLQITDCAEIYFNEFTTQLLMMKRSENITFDSCFNRHSTHFTDCRNLEIMNSTFSSYSTIQDSNNIMIHDNYRVYFTFYRSEVIEIFNNSLDQKDYYSRIAISDCSNTSIINNLLSSLTLSKSMDCIVSGNHIESNHHPGGTGIYMSATVRTTVEKNELNNLITGIYLKGGSTGNLVSENVIDGSNTGIYLVQNQPDIENSIINNVFDNCTMSSMTVGQLHSDKIYGNTMTGAGINIAHNMNSNVNVEISSNNTLNGKPVLSILDEDMGGAVIEDDYSQYLLFNTSNVIFRNFTHQNSYKGPVVHMSSNVTFDNFTVSGSGDWGFLLSHSDNVTLGKCSMNGTKRWPILSNYCDNLKIIDSNVENKRYQDTIITGGNFLIENSIFVTNGNLTMSVRDSIMINNTFDISENRVFN